MGHYLLFHKISDNFITRKDLPDCYGPYHIFPNTDLPKSGLILESNPFQAYEIYTPLERV